jgi:hypothetical protein
MRAPTFLLALFAVIICLAAIEQAVVGRAPASAVQVVEPFPAPTPPPPVPFVPVAVRRGAVYVLGDAPAPGCARTPGTESSFEYDRGAPFVQVTTSSGAFGGVGVYTLVCSGARQPGGGPVPPVLATYLVTYRICDGRGGPAHGEVIGGRLELYIWLCDTHDLNMSDELITISLVGFVHRVSSDLTVDRAPHVLSGLLPFVHDPPIYNRVYGVNIDLSELASGQYDLLIAVTGDPVTHAVPFDVR